MPEHQSEGQEIVQWIAKNGLRDVYLNIMEQYHLDANVGKANSTVKIYRGIERIEI